MNFQCPFPWRSHPIVKCHPSETWPRPFRHFDGILMFENGLICDGVAGGNVAPNPNNRIESVQSWFALCTNGISIGSHRNRMCSCVVIQNRFVSFSGIIILSAIANRFRLNKLSRVDQFVMSYGGKCKLWCEHKPSVRTWYLHIASVSLFTPSPTESGLRGAVAFALALLIKPERVEAQPMFVTTTIAVIYFTVFVQGITIRPLVKFLNVKRASKKKPTMNERIHERVSVSTRSPDES